MRLIGHEMLPSQVSENLANKSEPSVHNMTASTKLMVNSTPRTNHADNLESIKTTRHQMSATDVRPWSSCSTGTSGTRRHPGDGVSEIGAGVDRPDSMLSCVSSEMDSGFDDLRSFTVTPTAFPVASQTEIDVGDGGGRISEGPHGHDVAAPLAAGHCHDDVDEASDEEDVKDSRDESLNSDLYRSQDLTGLTDGSDFLSSSPDRDENTATASKADIEVSSLSEVSTVIRSETEPLSTKIDAAPGGTASCAGLHLMIEPLLGIDEEAGRSDSDEIGKSCPSTEKTFDIAKTANGCEALSSCSSSIDAVGDSDSCFELFQISDLSPLSMSKCGADVKRSSSSLDRFSDASAPSLLATRCRNCDTSARTREIEVLSSVTDQTPSSAQRLGESLPAPPSSHLVGSATQHRCHGNRLSPPAANGDVEIAELVAQKQSPEPRPVDCQVEECKMVASRNVNSSFTKLGATLGFNDAHLQYVPVRQEPAISLSDATENSDDKRFTTTIVLNEETSSSVANDGRSHETPETFEGVDPVEQMSSFDPTPRETVCDSSRADRGEEEVEKEIVNARRRRRKPSITYKRPRTHSPHPNVIHSSRLLSIAAALNDEEIDINGNDVTSMLTEPVFDDSKPSAAAVELKEVEDNKREASIDGVDVLRDMTTGAHPRVWQPWSKSRPASYKTTSAKINKRQSSTVQEFQRGIREDDPNEDRVDLPTESRHVLKALLNSGASSRSRSNVRSHSEAVDVAVQVDMSADVGRISAPSRAEVAEVYDSQTQQVNSLPLKRSCSSTALCEHIVSERLLASLPTYGVKLGFAAAETVGKCPLVSEAAVQTSSSQVINVDIKNGGDGKRYATAVQPCSNSIEKTAFGDGIRSNAAVATPTDCHNVGPSRFESTKADFSRQTTTEIQCDDVRFWPISRHQSCQQSVVYPIGDSYATSQSSTTSYRQFVALPRATTITNDGSAQRTRQHQSPLQHQTVMSVFHQKVPREQQDQVVDGTPKVPQFGAQPISTVNQQPALAGSAIPWSPQQSVLQQQTPRNIFIVENSSVLRPDSWRMPTTLPARFSSIRDAHLYNCRRLVPGGFQVPVMNRQRPSTPFPQQTYIRYHPYIQQPPQLSHNLYGSPLGSDVPQMMPEVADRKEATPQQNTLPNVRGVGSEAAEVLLDWINSSTSKSLYPTADEKRLLAARTGITTYQVNANIYKPRFVNLRSEVTTANCYAADSIWLTTTAK